MKWCEEDDRHIINIIDAIDKAEEMCANSDSIQSFENDKNWLISLRIQKLCVPNKNKPE